ncbi:MAG: hypothetical protein ACR2OC_00815 [Solirubrobacterales bacterium]
MLVAATVAAGCGGDGETTVTTTASTTAATETTATTGTTGTGETPTSSTEITAERAALIEEADAICAAGDAQIEAAQEPLAGAPVEEQQAFVTDTLVPAIQDQLDLLAELQPAEADDAEFRGIITDAQAAVDALAADPSLVTTEGVASPFAEVNARAQAFGLEACGS